MPPASSVFVTNAWLYSASENQWAGSLKMILEEVSAHYGPVHAREAAAQLIKLLIKNAIAAVCFLVAMWFVVTGRAGLVNLEDEYEDTGDQTSRLWARMRACWAAGF